MGIEGIAQAINVDIWFVREGKVQVGSLTRLVFEKEQGGSITATKAGAWKRRNREHMYRRYIGRCERLRDDKKAGHLFESVLVGRQRSDGATYFENSLAGL